MLSAAHTREVSTRAPEEQADVKQDTPTRRVLRHRGGDEAAGDDGEGGEGGGDAHDSEYS